MMTVAIIGLGLMGSSLALALNNIGFCKHIVGIDTNPVHCKEACELNIVNEIKELKEEHSYNKTTKVGPKPGERTQIGSLFR